MPPPPVTDAGMPPNPQPPPPPFDAGGQIGQESCGDVYNCWRACHDESCRQDCFANGTAEAQSEFPPVATCAVPQSCQDAMCRAFTCGDAVRACYDLNQVTGNSSCSQISQCDRACGNDPECRVDCLFKGTADAQTRYASLYGCGRRFNCRNESCYRQNCGTEIGACFFTNNPPPNVDAGSPTPIPLPDGGTAPDAGGMTLSCNGVLTCFSQCTTDQCAQNCFFSASPAGWQYLGPLFACANRAGCDDEDDWMACVQSSCQTEYASCSAN